VSTLVELSPNLYSPSAFAAFDASATAFSIDNALAMMWFSQLAYEADATDAGPNPTIGIVATGGWGFASVKPFVHHKLDLADSFETSGLIGERDDAVVLAFAGTDPGVWKTLATDFDLRPVPGRDIHGGFARAADAAKMDIVQAVALSRQRGKPLFVTGHSLGGALAALAAQQADQMQDGVTPRAVYVFGMPRTGGVTFRTAYNAELGDVTYRLVHGDDVVARVPPSATGFRHVGRMLWCPSGGKFSRTAPLEDKSLDDPSLVEGALDSFVSGIEGVFAGHLFQPEGPGTFGGLFKFLPQPIRDHLQDRYYGALSE
jgi:triacylglycerol lipase